MKVLFAGDFSTQGRLKNKREIDIVDMNGNKWSHIDDFAIVNYESPIASDGSPIQKDGPNLENRADSVESLKALGFNLVTLANNHLRDFGDKGVAATILECERVGMKHVGAGRDITEARTVQIITDGQIKIGILNVCESEFSVATHRNAGANPMDLISIYNDISQIKGNVDYVVMICHGGAEHYQLPTPRMKKYYRHFIDLGANVVINHHQHCFSGYEEYGEGLIFYGLGNFLFDVHWKGVPDTWYTGYMVRIDFDKGLSYDIIPYSQCREEPIVKLMKKDSLDENLKKLNDIIADDTLLENTFRRFVREKKHPLSAMQPYHNHYMRALYHRGMMPNLIPIKNKIEILNWSRCETYHEILTNYLEQELEEQK